MHLIELGLTAADLEPLIPFYRDTLGLELTRTDDGRVSFDAGATRLTFSGASRGTRPYYHVAFNIPENKIPAAMTWARSRFPLITPRGTADPVIQFPNINAHSLYFFDPAGNLLELIARHDLDNAGSGEFRPSDLLEASEIGIVVDDVPGLVSSLSERFGLGPLPGTHPSDGFAMIGDNRGTFIIVERGRTWLMTDDLPGDVFSTEVRIAAPEAGELTLPGYPYRFRSGRLRS